MISKPVLTTIVNRHNYTAVTGPPEPCSPPYTTVLSLDPDQMGKGKCLPHINPKKVTGMGIEQLENLHTLSLREILNEIKKPHQKPAWEHLAVKKLTQMRISPHLPNHKRRHMKQI